MYEDGRTGGKLGDPVEPGSDELGAPVGTGRLELGTPVEAGKLELGTDDGVAEGRTPVEPDTGADGTVEAEAGAEGSVDADGSPLLAVSGVVVAFTV